MTNEQNPSPILSKRKKAIKDRPHEETHRWAGEDRFIYTEPMLRRMLEEAFEYFERSDTALSIEGFLATRRIYRKAWTSWVNKHPWFKEAHEQFLIMIADRRDRGSITRKYDRESAYKSIHLYDPEKWKQIYEDSKRKNEAQEKPTTIVVEMKKVE